METTHTIKSSALTGTIHKVGNSPFWQLKFYHPSDRKRKRVSLATEDLALAKAKAKIILDDTADKGIAALREHARRDTSETIGAAIQHYLRVSKIDSANDNVNCMLRFLRCALGTDDNDVAKKKPLSILTPALIAKYRQNYKGSPYSIRTNLASTRAIFAHSLDWEGFELPDNVETFCKATIGMKAPVATFVRIAPEVLDKMEASSKAIGGAIRRAYLLTRYLGMTPAECAGCRKSWIEDREDGRKVIVIIERPEEDVTLKTGYKRGRVMSLPDWMIDQLMQADDYIIAGKTFDARQRFMLRTFNGWVREFIPDRRSAAYELRRQAGSDMLNATGKISLVQHMLGHTSPQTTARFYAVYDREVDVASVWDKPSNDVSKT
jgi:integrase